MIAIDRIMHPTGMGRLHRLTRFEPRRSILTRAFTSVMLIAMAAIATTCREEVRPPSETWAASESGGCTGLTLGWPVPLAELRTTLGPGLQPAAGPGPNDGLFLLFVASCPGSTIDGKPTGPFVTAHTLVPIEAPAGSTSAQGWIAIPETYAPDDSPVRALFRRHAFAERTGTATLELTSDSLGLHAHLQFTSDAGTLHATAVFAGPARHLDRTTGMRSVSSRRSSMVVGPERSDRLTGHDVVVSVQGTSPLAAAGLHSSTATPAAALDTAFTWRFIFDPDSARATRR